MGRVTRFALAAAAVFLLSQPAGAQGSPMCTQAGDGRFSLDFDIKPSVVVHGDAVMEATRGDLGLGGDPGERAFSLRRTLAAILASGDAPDDDAAVEAFLATMIDSFRVPTGRKLNPTAGIQMPLDDRTEATELDPAQMLDEGSSHAMRPLALFNRFDLVPEDWSHCGEHRIVYGKEKQGPLDRFLLIFEAVVPNPAPGLGAAGCRRVVEFWAGLSGRAEADQAAALSGFYYDGATGHPDGDLLDPVVNFRNYGGDGGRGQVRTNAFMDQPWQLREWLTLLTFAGPGEPPLAFMPVTVKGNPLAQLYRDDLAGDAELQTGNVGAAVAVLHGQFVQALIAEIGPNLLSERSAKHQELAGGLGDYDLGAPAVTEATILLNTISLGDVDRFNEHQSVSQGGEDVPGEGGPSGAIEALLDQVGAAPSPLVAPQTGETLLNRARAATCGGCHMTAARSTGGFFGGPGVTVRENADGTVVKWPDVDPGGFVHVEETTRALSPALEEAFLPVRRYVMGRYLCETLAEPPAPAPAPVPAPYQMAMGTLGLAAETVRSGRYLDEVLGGIGMPGAAEASAALATATGEGIVAAIRGMSEAERLAARESVGRAIDLARAIERGAPGAYVETRRPH